MVKPPTFDVDAAHRYFAAHCFNRAWDLIDKKDRTPEDDRMMVALNQASLYHWSQRPDVGVHNYSVSHWQASRIQALLGDADAARRQAETSLAYSHDLGPFLLGYAHEALARAHLVAGDAAAARRELATACALAEKTPDKDDRQLLAADLDQLAARLDGP